jgi:hypothetical protein
MHSLITSEPAFSHVFGMDLFAYIAQHPHEAANFDAAMADFTRQIAVAVAASYDFSPFRCIVDVGGGNGALVAGILQANPALTAVLFDLPHVAERAKASIAALGLADRCAVVGGGFFKSVPEGGGAYLLKHVIHDWNDVQAIEILQSCRRAMGSAARLLIVEGVYPPRIDQSDASRIAAANDVNMLVCTGGRQRSEAGVPRALRSRRPRADAHRLDRGACRCNRRGSSVSLRSNPTVPLRQADIADSMRSARSRVWDAV